LTLEQFTGFARNQLSDGGLRLLSHIPPQ